MCLYIYVLDEMVICPSSEIASRFSYRDRTSRYKCLQCAIFLPSFLPMNFTRKSPEVNSQNSSKNCLVKFSCLSIKHIINLFLKRVVNSLKVRSRSWTTRAGLSKRRCGKRVKNTKKTYHEPDAINSARDRFGNHGRGRIKC